MIAIGGENLALRFARERDEIRARGLNRGLTAEHVDLIFREVDSEACSRLCGSPIWRNQEARLRIDRAAREVPRS